MTQAPARHGRVVRTFLPMFLSVLAESTEHCPSPHGQAMAGSAASASEAALPPKPLACPLA